MLHYRISTHQYFYFYVTTFECWQSLWICTLGTVNNRKLLFAHSRAFNKSVAPRTDASTRCPPSFFFFYLVWWHLTLITPETPWHCPDHTISTALLSGSCVSYRVGAHAWSNEPQSVSRFFCRDAFITLARTVRRRNRTVLLSRDKLYNAVTWDERRVRERKKKMIVQ